MLFAKRGFYGDASVRQAILLNADLNSKFRLADLLHRCWWCPGPSASRSKPGGCYIRPDLRGDTSGA
jgi:hypothetical protein